MPIPLETTVDNKRLKMTHAQVKNSYIFSMLERKIVYLHYALAGMQPIELLDDSCTDCMVYSVDMMMQCI